MIGPRVFQFVGERDGFLRLALVHQVNSLFCVRGNIEFGGARLARQKQGARRHRQAEKHAGVSVRNAHPAIPNTFSRRYILG